MLTIRHVLNSQARDRADAVYLVAPEAGRTLTFGQLRRQSVALAQALSQRGLRKGDKVSLMLHNGYQTARLFIGVMYAGCVVSPINLLAQPSVLRHVLEHSDTRLVFTGAEHAPRLRQALAGIERRIDVIEVDVDAEWEEPAAPAAAA
jgi:long-chain acyl-CoA synthetase